MRLALNYQRVDPTKGGAETYVVDLCRKLIERGHEVVLHAAEWNREALPPGLQTVRVPVEGWTRPGKIRSFAENSARGLASGDHDCSIGFINTWGTDVLIPQGGVHEGSLEANAQRFAPGLARTAYLIGKRLNPKRGLYREIERRQYDPRARTRIVAVSNMVREHLERFHGVDPARVSVIPNAIDAGRLEVDDPAGARAEFRARMGLGPHDLVALFVGHNYRLKGLEPLLRSLASRKSRDPGARALSLVACGGGDVGPFRRLVRSLGLEETVRLAGFQADIRPAFHAADFFVLPTYYDPCSLVVFEALACGLPVVTTRCNGAGDVITEGTEGFVVDRPDAIDSLIIAYAALADDGRRRTMSEAARELGLRQSFDVHVDRLLQVCAEAARDRGSRAHRGATSRPLSTRSDRSDACSTGIGSTRGGTR
ncbi:MAG: glycosyltransferase family 4 protein [Isosphaeraceae bacterium]|nr:glycosyltransferase family 4 protein [Isosphaeraceae bacterium]